MDILTAVTGENDAISAFDEWRLNLNNGGHGWYSRAYVYQTLLDADSSSGANYRGLLREQHSH